MELRVSIGDYKVVQEPDTLITIGLGSCVGIVIYDEVLKIVGMAHILLPRVSDYVRSDNPLKFADVCIPRMVDEMISLGAVKSRLKARIAGGANMFKSTAVDNIGAKNSAEVERVLAEMNIPILAKDIGGHRGRTLYAESCDCSVYSRTVGLEKKLL